jgi:hypothetical protein
MTASTLPAISWSSDNGSVSPLELAPATTPAPVVLSDACRSMVLSFWATKGAGKSRALGRIIGYQDFRRGVPGVIFDPIGGTIDNFLDKIGRLPLEQRSQLWKRVRYVNMNGQDGRVIPFPIYYRAYENEPVSAVSRRYVATLIRSDPALSTAPILGENALTQTGLAVGIVLTALGMGVSEAWSLLNEPDIWDSRLISLANADPDTEEAVAHLRALAKLPAQGREMKVSSFETKLTPFRFVPTVRAMFSATTPGISWDEVVRDGQIVLLDFRHVDKQMKKFSLLWVYNSFLEFVKRRGHGFDHQPISLILDELSYFLHSSGDDSDLLTADINELMNGIARSHRLWVTIAGQELFQLPERLQKTVLASNVLLGQTSDEETAKLLASRFYDWDMYKVKKTDAVMGVTRDAMPGWPGASVIPAKHGVVAVRTTEITYEEHIYETSRRFLRLKSGTFLLGVGEGEGHVATSLRPISTRRVDQGEYVDEAFVGRIRAELMQRDGVQVDVLSQEITARVAGRPVPISRKPRNDEGNAQPQDRPRIRRKRGG